MGEVSTGATMEDVVLVGGIAFSILVSHQMRKRAARPTPQIAVCHFDEKGYVLFRSIAGGVKVECHLQKLPRGPHGFHVHEAGDLRLGCRSGCAHYNPEGRQHGGRTGTRRHRGDLGNVTARSDGTCDDVFQADICIHEMVGRMLVIHADEDDLGEGDADESLRTGNAGARIACSVIGIGLEQ